MTESPRGLRLPGWMALSMTRGMASPVNARTAALDSAGTEDRPESTQRPAALASSSSAEIPAQNAALSDRSR